MNRTEAILSKEQQHVLESAYTVLSAVTTYLTHHAVCIREEDSIAVERLVDFGVLVKSRLVQFFPTVEEFEKRGER